MENARPWERAKWSAVSWPVAALFFVLFFLLKLPVLGLPYHWDEGGAYVSAALWLTDAGLSHALPGLHPPHQFYGHPPGVYLGLATLYRVFGHSVWLTHVVAVALGAASLYLTFRIGHLIAGAAVGALAALLLLLDPLFFAQAGLMHGDMAVTAVGLAVTLFYLQGRVAAYLAAAIVLLALKETGVAIVVGIAVYHLSMRGDRPARAREAAWLLAPVLVLVAFFTATWLTSGHLVDNPYFEDHPLFTLSWAKLRHVTRWLFTEQGRWISTIAVVGALVAARPDFLRRELVLLLALVVPFWLAFGVLYFLPRYLLPALPFLCIAAALALADLGRRWALVPVVAVVGVVAVFSTGVTGESTMPGSHEANLEYVDVVKTHRDVAVWLEANRPDAKIAAEWPLRAALRNPALGYVSRPLDVVATGAAVDILAFTAQGAPGNREILGRAEMEGWRVLERFERNGKVAALFGRREASSAEQIGSPG